MAAGRASTWRGGAGAAAPALGGCRARRLLAPLALAAACLGGAGVPRGGFLGGPLRRVAASRTGGQLARRAGSEVNDDKEMLQMLKEWREETPKKPAPPKPAAASAKGFGAPKAVDFSRAVDLEVSSEPRPLRANDAIEELMKRGQAYADPVELGPQQLITIIFTFFSGWRQRNGTAAGDIELTRVQKQIVLQMVQVALATLRSSKDFWPTICAELGAGKDPEMRELVFALTGLRQ